MTKPACEDVPDKTIEDISAIEVQEDDSSTAITEEEDDESSGLVLQMNTCANGDLIAPSDPCRFLCKTIV